MCHGRLFLALHYLVEPLKGVATTVKAGHQHNVHFVLWMKYKQPSNSMKNVSSLENICT